MNTEILPAKVAKEVATGMIPPNYHDIVLASQERWHNLHRNGITSLPLSQGRDLPHEWTASITRLVNDNLPSYLPKEVQDRITALPQPIVSSGTFADRRFFESPVLFEEEIDEKIGQNENSSLSAGIGLLNEIAIDTLAEDTLSKIAANHRWFKPIAMYLKTDNPIRPAYISGLSLTKKLLGNKTGFETFRKELIASTLSGDTSNTDAFLKTQNHESLQALAIQVGTRRRYAPLETSLINLLGMSERIRSSLSGGFIHNTYPGVIFIPQVANLLYSINLGFALKYLQTLPESLQNPLYASINIGIFGLTGYLGLKTGLILPHLFIHELFHYYSTDINHWGLKKVKYLPELQPTSQP